MELKCTYICYMTKIKIHALNIHLMSLFQQIRNQYSIGLDLRELFGVLKTFAGGNEILIEINREGFEVNSLIHT
jgi:hypothetical protein